MTANTNAGKNMYHLVEWALARMTLNCEDVPGHLIANELAQYIHLFRTY